MLCICELESETFVRPLLLIWFDNGKRLIWFHFNAKRKTMAHMLHVIRYSASVNAKCILCLTNHQRCVPRNVSPPHHHRFQLRYPTHKMIYVHYYCSKFHGSRRLLDKTSDVPSPVAVCCMYYIRDVTIVCITVFLVLFPPMRFVGAFWFLCRFLLLIPTPIHLEQNSRNSSHHRIIVFSHTWRSFRRCLLFAAFNCFLSDPIGSKSI